MAGPLGAETTGQYGAMAFVGSALPGMFREWRFRMEANSANARGGGQWAPYNITKEIPFTVTGTMVTTSNVGLEAFIGKIGLLVLYIDSRDVTPFFTHIAMRVARAERTNSIENENTYEVEWDCANGNLPAINGVQLTAPW